jgi:Aminotransferase class-III
MGLKRCSPAQKLDLIIYFDTQGYLPGIRALCDKYNVLLIVDEVQTGLCRTGKMLASDHGPIRPGKQSDYRCAYCFNKLHAQRTSNL